MYMCVCDPLPVATHLCRSMCMYVHIFMCIVCDSLPMAIHLCRSAEMVKEEMAEDMGASQQEAACASDSASSATGH